MEELLPGLVVSRETVDRLRSLEALLAKWTPAINLVSKTTVGQAWQRHILDSAQLFQAESFGHWADLGSGGGFPGLVIAVLAHEKHPTARVTLVESDQRKATFLREAARTLGVATQVISERIEAVPPLNADILSARALAPLPVLCGFARLHLRPGGLALFPKGAGWRNEVADARKEWMFDIEAAPSVTDADAVVLKLKAINHV